MVRPSKVKDVTISVESWQEVTNQYHFLNHPDNLILDGITINWGRDSLYNAPRNRTAAFTIGPHTGEHEPGWWLYRKVSVKIGNTLLFMGTIDRAETYVFSHVTGYTGVYTKIEAVEGALFDARLHSEKDVLVTDLRSLVTPWEADMRRHGIGIQMAPDSPILARFYEPAKLTMKRSLELALESAGLLTQAQWLPNHQHIRPTITKRWQRAPITDYIPASNADITRPSATIEKTPRSWVVSTGGEYGNETVWFYRENLPGPIPSPRAKFNVPVQWNHNQQHNSNLMEDGMQLAQHINSDPQQVTIIDGGKQELKTDAHLRTWETPDRGIKFTGTFEGDRFRNPYTGQIEPKRYRGLHDDSKYWYPIGGQLHISSEKITHKFNAIKIAPTG